MDTPKSFYLPDAMNDWPWPRMLNPHFEAVKVEVDAWFRDFKTLGHEVHEAFDKSGVEHLRIACEFMITCFIVDEYTEVDGGAFAKQTVDIIIDALHNPRKMRPEGEFIVGEVTRQFWARAVQNTTPSFQRHFICSFTAYLNSVVDQALDRDHGHRRKIVDHFEHRRHTSGTYPCLAMSEIGMDLPDEVAYHPVIVELNDYAADLIAIENDMFSYNREQAVGNDNNNLIPAVMLELGLDVSGAMIWAAHYYGEVQKKFLDGLAKVPSWGPSIDALVKEYIDGIATWVRATYCWSFEVERYFETSGAEIQETRIVRLLPKVNSTQSAGVVEKVASITD
ncbi:terpenoid synthase [Rhizopogon salebrosus TDB-379]|nr:terpenoid synthase [Rhizopogon salebrosus TDB-379]